jgi:hypothetical protein
MALLAGILWFLAVPNLWRIGILVIAAIFIPTAFGPPPSGEDHFTEEF